MTGPRKNLAGKIFGRLTVTRYMPDARRRDGQTALNSAPRTWECSCTCGTIITVRPDHLVSGRTQSCGCIRQETRKASASARRQLALSYAAKRESIARENAERMDHTPGRKSGADSSHALPHGTYARMFDEQGGVCAICGAPPPDGRPLHLDHCHTTEQVRGLLCNGCNAGLGFFGDDITRMAKAMRYLTLYREPLLRRGGRGVKQPT